MQYEAAEAGRIGSHAQSVQTEESQGLVAHGGDGRGNGGRHAYCKCSNRWAGVAPKVDLRHPLHTGEDSLIVSVVVYLHLKLVELFDIFTKTQSWHYRPGTVNSNTVNSKFHSI